MRTQPAYTANKGECRVHNVRKMNVPAFGGAFSLLRVHSLFKWLAWDSKGCTISPFYLMVHMSPVKVCEVAAHSCAGKVTITDVRRHLSRQPSGLPIKSLSYASEISIWNT